MFPTKQLRFQSASAFARIAGELYRRSGAGRTEAGCFLLGQIRGESRTADDVVFFDEIDPDAYRHGSISLNTAKLSALYDRCEERGLAITGDIHTHPCLAFQSWTDKSHPVVSVAGHVAIVLPYDGRYRISSQIGAYILKEDGSWDMVRPSTLENFLGIDSVASSVEDFDRMELMLLNQDIVQAKRHELLASLAVEITISKSDCQIASGQAALLTAVALCARFARAGVVVRLPRDAPLAVDSRRCLSSELARLGAVDGAKVAPSATLAIGNAKASQSAFEVRIVSENGRYGCLPAQQGGYLADDYVPGVLIGTALAVGEVFRTFMMQKTELAPRSREVALWTDTERAQVPASFRGLVKSAWLAGFGHLGNAYAWAMAFTPRLRPALFVQDSGIVDFANASTQLFIAPADIGRRKTEVARNELEAFGFHIVTDDRALDASYPMHKKSETMLVGFDNVPSRRALAHTRVPLIIDAGLGNLASTFSTFAIHTFTEPALALELFPDYGYVSNAQQLIETGAYRELAPTEEARCGMIAVADATVAVPFVGMVVAGLVITQLIRKALDMPARPLIAGDVLSDPIV